jgi:Ras-related protein Rab-5C
MLLCDLTEPEPFVDLAKWVNFARTNSPQAAIILFGNKTDLVDSRRVNKDEAQEFADKNRLIYYEGSAKTGENVHDAVDRLAEFLAQGSSLPSSQPLNSSTGKQPKGCC